MENNQAEERWNIKLGKCKEFLQEGKKHITCEIVSEERIPDEE